MNRRFSPVFRKPLGLDALENLSCREYTVISLKMTLWAWWPLTLSEPEEYVTSRFSTLKRIREIG